MHSRGTQLKFYNDLEKNVGEKGEKEGKIRRKKHFGIIALLLLLSVRRFRKDTRDTASAQIFICTQMRSQRAIIDSKRKENDAKKRTPRLTDGSFNLRFSFLLQVRSLRFFSIPSPGALRSRTILTSITYVSSHIYNGIDINNE